MKKLVFKIGLISLVAATSLFAVENNNAVKDSAKNNIATNISKVMKKFEAQIKYETKRYKATIKSFDFIEKLPLDKDWQKIRYKIVVNYKNKDITRYLEFYTNGKYFTRSMIDAKTGVNLGMGWSTSMENKDRAKMVLDTKYYNQEHLIYGDIDAKNKVVIFSDPLCIACIGSAPRILEAVKKKDKNELAVFYYDFPLNMHPTAKTIVVAMHLAKKQGIKDVEYRVYKANFDKLYKDVGENVYKTTNHKKALEIFNQAFKTNFTMKQIEKAKDIQKTVAEDFKAGVKAGVSGTPTVFFNGKQFIKDVSARAYLDQYLKQ